MFPSSSLNLIYLLARSLETTPAGISEDFGSGLGGFFLWLPFRPRHKPSRKLLFDVIAALTIRSYLGTPSISSLHLTLIVVSNSKELVFQSNVPSVFWVLLVKPDSYAEFYLSSQSFCMPFEVDGSW